MKATIVVNFMGVFAFDENGKMIANTLFPKKPEEIAKRLQEKEAGGNITEELKIIENLGKKGYDSVSSSPAGDFDFDFRKFALKEGWMKSNTELNQILSKVSVLLTKSKLKVVKSDRVLMQVVGVVDDMDRFLNVFSERLKEWHGLYSGEAGNTDSNEIFVNNTAKEKGKNLKEVSTFAKTLSDFYSVRKGLGEYIERLGKKTVPNLTTIAGSILAARLLELAGGLDKLAKMSSSKIQLLGAEKALFRHLKGEGRSPKYGLLFSHPYVQAAPGESKGKVARLVAAKLSLAARVDFFSKEDRSAEMKRELDKQVKGLIKT
jgi:nucleolar protein 56